MLYWFHKKPLLHLGTDQEDDKPAEVQVQKLLNLLRREHGSEVAERDEERERNIKLILFEVKRKVN